MVDVSKIRERFDELSTPILKSGRLYQLATFTQHGTTSTLDHVIAVAYSSLAFAMNAGMTTTSMIGTITRPHQTTGTDLRTLAMHWIMPARISLI